MDEAIMWPARVVLGVLAYWVITEGLELHTIREKVMFAVMGIASGLVTCVLAGLVYLAFPPN